MDLLESILNTQLGSFEFNNENCEGWEQQQNSRSSECGPSECGLIGRSIDDKEAHDTNSKGRKYPFKKNVPIPGNVSFQIEPMEICQRHKTDCIMRLFIYSIIISQLANSIQRIIISVQGRSSFRR